MKQSVKNWWRRQREDFREFCEIIGLRNSMQQMAIGAALCILLLVACGIGEAFNH